MQRFKGSFVAVATPMKTGVTPDVAIDFEGLSRLLEFHIDNGTDGIVAVGTTGESATLSETEHCKVVESVVTMVRGRLPVIAGTGANSTREALSLTMHAKRAGVDACLLVTPYYNKPTQEGLYQHYRLIAEEVDIPQILYNVPGRTACDMLPETVARLATLRNIIGVKEAVADIQRIIRLRELCPHDFLIFSGDDLTARECLLHGGDGVISVTANVAPHAMHAMCMAALDGDIEKAGAIDATIAGLHQALFVEANPIPTKWALHKMGLIKEGIRQPLTWLAPSFEKRVAEAMSRAGITH